MSLKTDREVRLERLCRELLEIIGEDPDRPGLQDTPRRWASWWEFFLRRECDLTPTVFECTHTSVVKVSGIRSWSLCEHHLLPFTVEVDVSYIPNGRLLGLSKFHRIVTKECSRLSVQETLTDKIHRAIMEVTGSDKVLVEMRGEHSCMGLRGIGGPIVTTTVVGGLA